MSSRTLPTPSSSSPSTQSVDADDDLADYNILGMHSPGDREISGSLHDSSEEDDEDEDDDEDMSDESGSVEGEYPDPLELQGHW